MRWYPVYIGLGSNLDSPRDQVLRAVAELRETPGVHVTAVSSLYRSSPMGPADQPDFINAVAAAVTTLEPHDLLRKLRGIEDAHGRDRAGERWGPRTLDLDLLVYGGRSVSDETLVVPHPGIAERNFVLLPLCELAPHLEIPGLGAANSLLGGLSATGIDLEKLG